MLQVHEVTKTFRQGAAQVRALDQVSLEVGQGGFVAIMGPSGSGKSTLLHLIAGLDVPDCGTVTVQGQNLAAMSDDQRTVFRRRKIGIIFQFPNLRPGLSVAENVALPMAMDKRPAREIQPRVDAVLRQLGLWTRRDQIADALSGGEVQKVSIARALVAEPPLILADEPTGNLDSKTGEEILNLIKAGAANRRTVLIVTHDEDVAAHADRIVHLKDGRIVSDAGLR